MDQQKDDGIVLFAVRYLQINQEREKHENDAVCCFEQDQWESQGNPQNQVRNRPSDPCHILVIFLRDQIRKPPRGPRLRGVAVIVRKKRREIIEYENRHK